MLDLTHCDELSQAELREHRRVRIREDGSVAVETKKGEWASDPSSPDGLHSLTQKSLALVNKAGTYAIPSKEEWDKEAAIRAMPNPWKREAFNLTQQLLIADQEPDLAARFQREARS